MNNYKLYLDESGNTGTNYTDVNQHVFVYGGWLVKTKDIKNVKQYISNCFGRSKAFELKSTNVLKTYRNDLYAFLKGAIQNKMFPFFFVMDKIYALLVNAVEMFFDYAHNSNVNSELTFNFNYKANILNNIYGNQQIIDLMSCLIRNGTLDILGLRELKNELSIQLWKNDLNAESTVISKLTDEELLKMVEEYEIISANGGKGRLSPGPTAIVAIMHNVNGLMKSLNGTVDIVRDEIYSKKTFDIIDSIVSYKSLFPSINSIVDNKSDKEPLLQAADLLCGFVASAINGKITSKEIMDIWEIFIYYQRLLEKGNINPILYMMKSDQLYFFN